MYFLALLWYSYTIFLFCVLLLLCRIIWYIRGIFCIAVVCLVYFYIILLYSSVVFVC